MHQTTVGYYDLGTTLYDLDGTDIKVHTFQPDEMIKARVKSTKELTDVEGTKFRPDLHSIFIDGREFNVINVVSKYLGTGDDLNAQEEHSEEPVAKSKGKHPSKKSKVSKDSKPDKCG